MCCAIEPSGWCCSLNFAGASEAIASVRPATQLTRPTHSCCERRHESQGSVLTERLSNPKDKNQCCLLESHTSGPAALLPSFDHRTIAPNQTLQRIGIKTRPQPPGFIWRATVTNRGSTYLLCCVFLI